MPCLAVRLVGLPSSRADASQNVFPLRNSLHMGDVYAGTIPAKVIDLKTVWDGSALQQIGCTMRVRPATAKL
jgi:hypothetical protein